jgi:hypothetical protein
MRFWTLLFLATALGAADLRVIYTGDLIGYARACAEEQFVPGKVVNGVQHYDRKCIQSESSFGQALQTLFKQARTDSTHSLLLGTGDHFSLDYRARSVVVQTAAGPRAIGKDELLYHEPHGWIILSDADPKKFANIVESQSTANTVIEGDAVAQFLLDAGYDALVPGKHDFYFGAERLRQISRFLARQPKPTQMLGTNLVITGKLLDPPNRVPDRFRKKNYTSPGAAVTFTLPTTVLPWVRQFGVTGNPQRVVLCPVTANGRDEACPANGEIIQLETKAANLYALPKSQKPLKEITAYHLCAKLEKTQVCTLFEVAQPFFQYGQFNSQDAFPAPYFHDPKRNAVVMGIVLPGLEKQVGLLNTVWLDPKHRHEIRATTIDAIQSLEQLLDYCEAAGHCTPETQMILLAQMPAEAASSVQRRTKNRFDLVIAESNPFTFTPFPSVQYPASYPPLVVSPKPIFDDNAKGTISVHAQSVRLDGKRRPFATRTFVGPSHALYVQPGAPISKALKTALQRLDRHPGDTDSVNFRQLVLETMRVTANASVALLQRRDLFKADELLQQVVAGPATDDDKLRAAVESILWKGDFLTPSLVKGSSLKRALDRSFEFDEADRDVYYYEAESKRGLLSLGIFRDPDSLRYIVNGAPIEDDKPYLVAMTDYLAFGDTGYPELAQELTGGPERAANIKVQSRLSELVLNRLRDPEAAKLARGKAIDFSTYLDYLEWPGFPVEPEATLAMQFSEYFRTAATGTPSFTSLNKGATTNQETLTQTRPRWRLVLERSDISWSDYWHNQSSQSALLTAFEGITESRVNTPENHQLNTSWAAELRREKISSTDFLRSEGRLQNLRIASTDSRLVHTYPQNEISVEAGWRHAVRRSIFQRPWWGVQLSGIVNTQLQNPLFAARVAYRPQGDCPNGDCRATLSYDASLGRTTRTLAKLGVRRETRDSWAEWGLFTGVVRRPASYQIEDLAPCQLQFENLASCLANATRILPNVPTREDLKQQTTMGGGMESGMFMNFQWRIPLMPSNAAQLVVENRGRWYFKHGKDIPLDTRLSNLFTAGLSIPIAGRLALKPTWTLFHYMNKDGLIFARLPAVGLIRRPGVLLMGNGFDVKAEYRFDWTEGQSWLKILKYGR